MTPPRLNLLVIQSEEHSNTVRFYELLGLHFQEEQHGKGPVHWAATSGGLVMEIYPARSSDEVDGDRHANRTHFGAERSSRKSDPPQKTVESACFSGRFDVKDVAGGRIRSVSFCSAEVWATTTTGFVCLWTTEEGREYAEP